MFSWSQQLIGVDGQKSHLDTENGLLAMPPGMAVIYIMHLRRNWKRPPGADTVQIEPEEITS